MEIPFFSMMKENIQTMSKYPFLRCQEKKKRTNKICMDIIIYIYANQNLNFYLLIWQYGSKAMIVELGGIQCCGFTEFLLQKKQMCDLVKSRTNIEYSGREVSLNNK